MSPSAEPFNETKYKALMDGLECSEISYNIILSENRLDSEFFLKGDLLKEKQIDSLSHFKISDFAFVTDGIHTSIDFDENSKINLISAKAPKKNFFDLSGTGYISYRQNNRNPRTQLISNDVIVSTVGTIGNCAVVNESVLPANADRHVGIIRINDDSVIKPRYLSTFILSKYGQYQTRRFTTGNVQPNLFIYKVKDIKVPLISVDWQMVIEDIVLQAEMLFTKSKRILSEIDKLLQDNLSTKKFERQNYSTKMVRESFYLTGRLDAEYYQMKYEMYENAVFTTSKGYTYVKEQFKPIKTKCLRDLNAYNYVEIGDIDIVNGTAYSKTIETNYLPDNAKIMTKIGDILVSTVRPNRGAVAILESDNILVSGAFTVLRENGNYPKELLQALFRTSMYKDWLLRFNVGTSYPVIRDMDVLNMPIPAFEKNIENTIVSYVKKASFLRCQSKELIEYAKQAVEIAIEQGEEKALKWLKEKGVEC